MFKVQVILFVCFLTFFIVQNQAKDESTTKKPIGVDPSNYTGNRQPNRGVLKDNLRPGNPEDVKSHVRKYNSCCVLGQKEVNGYEYVNVSKCTLENGNEGFCCW